MKHASLPSSARKPLVAFAAMTLLAGCDSIGDGSTVQSLQIFHSPVIGGDVAVVVDRNTAGEKLRMFDCFCSNLLVIGTFTDSTQANFNFRARWSSDRPEVVSVVNNGDAVSSACPLLAHGPGLLIPQGVGTATITAEFVGITTTYRVEVLDTSAQPNLNATLAPLDSTNTGQLGVGTDLPLRARATLDGRERILNNFVTTWAFDNPNDSVATLNAIGNVRGFSRSGATPLTARASFGTCSDVSPTLAVAVGDVAAMTLVEESNFATDQKLAVNSDERLRVTAQLDTDGDAEFEGEQLVGGAISLNYTDQCTIREFDAAVPTTNCRETASTSCPSTLGTCAASTATLCTSGMSACRTESSPIITTGANRILAQRDAGTPTTLNAFFPAFLGTSTTLAADVDAAATTLTVAAVSGFPSVPWEATIDSEAVRVTSVSGTTLTVMRGVRGTTAAAHASGAAFVARSVTSPTLDITAKAGTLSQVAIESPGTLSAFGTLQLEALGTFVDAASVPRQQRVTRLTPFAEGSPDLVWFSSDSSVAFVDSESGLVSGNACGGRASIRARSTTSSDTTTATFDSATTADDTACRDTDALCDQVDLCVATPSPLPPGLTCSTTTTCP